MIICDSSSIIALNETCNSNVFHFLQELDFVIPPAVEEEIVINPIKVKQFAMHALRMQMILREKEVRIVSKKNLEERTEKVLRFANNSYFIDGKPLTLVQRGEAACLALLSLVGARLLLIDEKTTRMILEDPLALQRIIQEEHGKKVKLNSENLKRLSEMFDGAAILRSTELITIAARKGFFARFEEDETKAYHAAIYALRFAGCSITTQELSDYDELDVSPPFLKG